MNRLAGKVAVVTGAAFGNGRGIALRFAEEGADLVLADVDGERMQETARMVGERGRRVLARTCDVSVVADIETLFRDAAAELGRVDVAVANAGVAEEDTDCLSLSEAEWDRTLDVNLKGVFFTLQAGARRMLEQGGGGRLIAIASVMARLGSVVAPAYCASKGGVVQLVRSFAVACGRHGITCNAIAPGYIETAMTRRITENPLLHASLVDRTPVGRVGRPEDVGELASFLASDAAGFVTGEVVFTDGGLTAGMYSAAAETARAAAAAE